MGSERFNTGRHAGLLLPLFCAPSRESWGVGELGDLPILSRWLRQSALDVLLILPLNEMNPGQHSPYSAVSAMAIDPLYVSLRNVSDFVAVGGEPGLDGPSRLLLEHARGSERIAYTTVRTLKMGALWQAFSHFLAAEWQRHSKRAQQLQAYCERERWWLDDYTLYRVLRDRHDARPWWAWEQPLATRDPTALSEARANASRECLFYAYVQWVAEEQWHAARAAAAPVGVFGDLPFMVSADSADAWAEQHAFRFDASVGAPPDAFSEAGQNWGLPVYRWDVFRQEDDAWLRARARRAAALFDAFRVDHVVGFYRTYVIPVGEGDRGFSPSSEHEQFEQGERIMRAVLAAGAGVIAEDLGTIPPFVRESLARLGIPGYKVVRWERDWETPGQPFRDPLRYPEASLATTGTHDTETLAEWWEASPREEREKLLEIPFLRERGLCAESPTLDDRTLDALLEMLWASGSSLVVVPVQDLFGWKARINVPATVSPDNWTWRLPWPLDVFGDQPDTAARSALLSRWAKHYRRGEGIGS